MFQGIKESLKGSRAVGRSTPPHIAHRPEVYGLPRVGARRRNAKAALRADHMRLLKLVGYVMD